MAKKPFFSEREVRMARSFIKAIGANAKNGYLLLAVIAWQRAMSKSHDSFFKSLSKYNAFAAGAKLAAKLKAKAGMDIKNYLGVLKSLRRKATTNASTIAQARDFLLAIQQSAWDKKKYGYKPYVAGHWETVTISLPPFRVTRWVPEQQEHDPLSVIWSKLTGHNIPKAYFNDGTVVKTITPKPRREPARQPRSLVHVLEQPDYIQPYGASRFYDARPHLGSNILPE